MALTSDFCTNSCTGDTTTSVDAQDNSMNSMKVKDRKPRM